MAENEIYLANAPINYIQIKFLISGPSYWKTAYPQCDGKNQSPINIATDKTLHKPELGPIHFSKDYIKIPKGDQWIIKNNGHSGKILNNIHQNFDFFKIYILHRCLCFLSRV